MVDVQTALTGISQAELYQQVVLLIGLGAIIVGGIRLEKDTRGGVATISAGVLAVSIVLVNLPVFMAATGIAGTVLVVLGLLFGAMGVLRYSLWRSSNT